MDGEPRAEITKDLEKPLVKPLDRKVVKQVQGDQAEIRKEQATTREFLEKDRAKVDAMQAERRGEADRGGKGGEKNVSAASLGQIKIDASEAAVKARKGKDEAGVIGAQAVSDAISPKK